LSSSSSSSKRLFNGNPRLLPVALASAPNFKNKASSSFGNSNRNNNNNNNNNKNNIKSLGNALHGSNNNNSNDSSSLGNALYGRNYDDYGNKKDVVAIDAVSGNDDIYHDDNIP